MNKRIRKKQQERRDWGWGALTPYKEYRKQVGRQKKQYKSFLKWYARNKNKIEAEIPAVQEEQNEWEF